MQLTDKQVDNYIKLYRKTFGKGISKQEALQQGLALVYLVSKIVNNNENENQHGRATQVCE